jgi:hypothetical protein
MFYYCQSNLILINYHNYYFFHDLDVLGQVCFGHKVKYIGANRVPFVIYLLDWT